jgi:3-oxoacid CoA-transferase subunit B
VVMEHCNKHGDSKILRECSLPLTGKACVDMVITDLCVFEVGDDGLVLKELAPGVSEQEIHEKTQARFSVGAGLREISLG